ncbi:MAG: recombinase family protein [Burkholderiales bacterium]|nr:recombinase family protein [Burkholderiales bacterium]
MHTAYSYVRFSSKAQELGDSMRRQVGLARAYATQHGLFLDERSYQDLGISAFKGKNAVDGALGAFLKAVDDKIIPKGSFLLVESLDRVSREEVLDALETFMSIVKRGIVLVTLTDKQEYTRESIRENWTKLIMALAVMARANEESATKSRRIKSSWAGKRERGEILTAVGPSWLELNEKRTEWKVIPKKVKVVEMIFQHAASGFGAPKIATILNDKHVPTMATAEYWEPGIVMAMLKNSSVIGTYTPKKAKADPIEGYYPQVIKPEVFYAVQGHIARRRGTGGRKGNTVANLFSGIIRCECGSRMRYVSGTAPHYYLQCLKAYSNVGCDAPRHPYGSVESAILQDFLYQRNELLLSDGEVLDDPAVAIRGELAERRAALDNLMQLVEAGKSYAGGMSKVAERMQTIEIEIDALERAIKTVQKPTSSKDAYDVAMALYDKHNAMKKTPGPALEELRLQMQASMKRLLTKIVLTKELKHYKKRSGEDVYLRVMELHGPIAVEGAKLNYFLPKQGFGGSPKRRNRMLKPV